MRRCLDGIRCALCLPSSSEAYLIPRSEAVSQQARSVEGDYSSSLPYSDLAMNMVGYETEAKYQKGETCGSDDQGSKGCLSGTKSRFVSEVEDNVGRYRCVVLRLLLCVFHVSL